MHKITHLLSGEFVYLTNEMYNGFATKHQIFSTLISCCERSKCSHLTCEICPWNSDEYKDAKILNADLKAQFVVERVKCTRQILEVFYPDEI